ncbi:WD40 repeat-like protein [Coprinellus micaceus]|uniref:WD40 repeat-like protein n=1 Tax=Coprinellus micaceus TaxID=71717 RepID=A0A4Y7T1H2_COPMI|nr:WD40 repeat-like protein [Coprinellus micaceus]
MNEETTWAPPVYDLETSPQKTASFKLCSNTADNENFVRCAKISPDGSSFIAQCEDHSLQLFDFPNAPGATGPGSDPPETSPRLSLKQGAPVVDFAWFPSASRHDSASYCFATSVRECPVKLIDATTGKLRASYRIVDHRERHIAPHSLAFTFGGDRLFCGFEDAIEVFDVGQPGEGTRRHTTLSKKSKDGLKGIISAIAFSTHNSTSSDALFAAGSLTPIPGNIALYTDLKDEALMFIGGGPRAGVTQLQFNHYRPHVLYAAYRGVANGTLYSWDIRSRVDVPLAVYDARPEGGEEATRNQRLRFDLDIGGRYLGTGNWAGEVALFDVAKIEQELGAGIGDELKLDFLDDAVEVQPTTRFKAHEDTVTAVAFQPWKAEMLTVSGSRHFHVGEDDPDQVKRFDNSITSWDVSPAQRTE